MNSCNPSPGENYRYRHFDIYPDEAHNGLPLQWEDGKYVNNYSPFEKGGHIVLHKSVCLSVCRSVRPSVDISVSLNILQLITQEHFVPEAS